MKMKTVTLLIFPFLLFTACTAPQVDYNKKIKAFELTYKHDILFTQDALRVFESRVNLSNINIYQYIYKLDNGEFIVYEQAYAHPYYIFDASIDKLISKIFPHYHSKRSAVVDNLYFYTLKSSVNNETMYMLVENQNKKLLKIMYAKDKRMLEAIMQQLDATVKFADQQNSSSSICFKGKKEVCRPFIKSEWNHKNTIFVELVKRQGGSARSRR
jgi:hypothetical protein